MATIDMEYALTKSKQNVTSGNEVIWRIPLGKKFIIQGVGSGRARTYTSNSTSAPSSFSDMVAVSEDDFTSNFQDIPLVDGQQWVGIKVEEGEWDISLSLDGRGVK